MAQLIRYDLQLIADWIEPGSRVLDLGCGRGDLLLYLREHKGVVGTGIESSEEKVAESIAAGLPVLQGDINEEVEDYEDNTFDYIIVSQTLQQIHDPLQLLRTLTRIGRKIVVSFPNFAHWRGRLQALFLGIAPRTRQLPFDWYNTPNIRVITLKDFRRFTREAGLTILREAAINTNSEDRRGRIVTFLPNLLATYGIMLITRTPPNVIDLTEKSDFDVGWVRRVFLRRNPTQCRVGLRDEAANPTYKTDYLETTS